MKRIIAAALALLLVASACLALGETAAETAAAVETPAATQAEPSAATAAPVQDTAAPAAQSTAETQSSTGSDAGLAAATPEAAGTDQGGNAVQTEQPADPAQTGGATEGEPPATDLPTTQAPATQSPAATETVADAPATAQPAPAAEANVGSGPAWIAEGAHRRYGEVDALLPAAMAGNATIMLASTAVLEVRGYSLETLRAVAFGVDADALGDYADGRQAMISAFAPSGGSREGVVFVWVGLPGGSAAPATQAENPAAPAQPEVDGHPVTEILVSASGFTSGAACTPTFTLAASPGMGEGMTFGVSVNGGGVSAVSGAYAPTASGEYRFFLLDAGGAELARSIAYAVTYGLADTAQAQPSENAEADAAPQGEADASGQTDADAAPQGGTEDALLTQGDVAEAVPATQAYEETAPPELTVRAYDYVQGVASSVTPRFVLSGAPSGSGYIYGVSVNGGEVKAIAGDTCTLTESGSFALVFSLLAEDGTVMDVSPCYSVVLDFSQAAATGEAWMAQNGAKVYGTLSSLLSQAEGGATLYILTDAVLTVHNTAALSSVTLLPDPEHYGAGFGVVISANSPDGAKTAGVRYVWIGVDVADPKEAAAPPATFSVQRIAIGSRTLSAGLWVNGTDALTFTVTDTLEGNAYRYEISLDGGVTF
ncbi:MAG: hypothetical protein VB041_08045, partial [Candidatus Limiplasma sp.]|nr:hypothetical protein [Candidatus Limiplasma sp.]